MAASQPPINAERKVSTVGEPPGLSDTVRTTVLNAIASGANRETAAAAAGVATSTLKQWLRKGRQNVDEFYVRFLADVQKAEAAAEVRNSNIVQTAARGGTIVEKKTVTTTKADGTSTTTVVEKLTPGQWQAAAWYLERKYPQRWGAHRGEIRMLEAQLREAYEQLADLKAKIPSVARPDTRPEPTSPATSHEAPAAAVVAPGGAAGSAGAHVPAAGADAGGNRGAAISDHDW